MTSEFFDKLKTLELRGFKFEEKVIAVVEVRVDSGVAMGRGGAVVRSVPYDRRVAVRIPL